jgi:hypothetical protein
MVEEFQKITNDVSRGRGGTNKCHRRVGGINEKEEENMKNVFRFVSIAAFVIVMAFALNASAGDCPCDSQFTVHAGPAYNKCKAENCSGAPAKKSGDGDKAVSTNTGGGGKKVAKTPKEVWCPSANKLAGGMVPLGEECKSCESFDMILSEDGRTCIDKCSLVPVWASCMGWCPSKNEGTGGAVLAGEPCIPCQFGDNGVACLKEAPLTKGDLIAHNAAIKVELASIQAQLNKPKQQLPIWKEWWFWVLAGLGLANLVLIVFLRRMILENRNNQNQIADFFRKKFVDQD